MRARSRPFFSMVFLLFISACGGASTNFNSNLDPLLTEIERLNPRNGETLPSSGSANYAGALGFTLLNGESYEGLLSITANLSADSISGQVTDFRNLEGGEVVGTLRLSNGAIERELDVSMFYIFNAELNGVLTDNNHRIVFDTLLLGDFLDGDRQFLSGIIRGDVYVDGEEVALVDSSFVAECEGALEVCNDALVLKPQIQNLELLRSYERQDLILSEVPLDLSLSATQSLPTVGNAQYSGVAFIDTLKPGLTLLGALELNFDLEDGEFTGVASEFVNRDADVFEGILTIEGGAIDRSEGNLSIESDFLGTLNDANDTYEFDGSSSGAFLGNDAEYVFARPTGIVVVDGTSYDIAGGIFRAVPN